MSRHGTWPCCGEPIPHRGGAPAIHVCLRKVTPLRLLAAQIAREADARAAREGVQPEPVVHRDVKPTSEPAHAPQLGLFLGDS